MNETIAILGNGTVGTTLGSGLAALGYRIVFSTRDPDNEKSIAALRTIPGAIVLGPDEALAQAERWVINALPWAAVAPTLRHIEPDAVTGKIVIDACNPLTPDASALALGFSDSAGETVQRLLPSAKVVKAFNIIGAGRMVSPQFADGSPDMFIAGDDAQAKAAVSALLQQLGWRPAIDMGDISASRLLEPLAMLWINYAFRHGHSTHGFSLLDRQLPA